MTGDWSAWIGREECREDRLDEGALARWAATLDRDVAGAGAEKWAPQGAHWCLAPPDAPTARLGEDGHPLRDDAGLLPPVPLPRRMWASSIVEFVSPLPVGAAIVRRSRVASVREKQGGTGPLVFVEVDHETATGDGTVAVRERQSIVYRDAAAPDAALSPPPAGDTAFDPTGWRAHRRVVPTPPLLFRYSALTFNSHRIHYDLPYAREVERYRGLVVHGPLTATLLLDVARREYGEQALSTFAFRGLSPAIADEPLHLVLRGGSEGLELGAFAADGRAVMSATGTLAAA